MDSVFNGLNVVPSASVGCASIVTTGLIASYLLTGTAEDSVGSYNGTESSASYAYDTERGIVYSGGGSITIPSTGGTSCTYWVDSGSGWVFTYTTSIPSSLTTNKYSNLHVYDHELTAVEQAINENAEYQIHNISIDNGLLDFYPLHGNSLDNALNQYDGTDTSVTYSYDSTLGIIVGVFNGASSKISLPTALTAATGSMSVSYWVKTSLSDANLRSAVEGSIIGSGEWVTYFINGKLRLAYYGIGGSSTINGTTTISDGNWHLITEVLDNTNGTLKVYIDTVEDISYSFTPSVTLYQFSGTSYIGCTDNTIRFFYGSIANVRIYNRVLSATEMGILHDYESGLICLENAQNI